MSEYLSTLWIPLLCLSAGFLQTKKFCFDSHCQTEYEQFEEEEERKERRERVSKWVRGRKMKKKNEKDSQNTKTTPTPLHSCTLSSALYEISKKEEGSKRAWAAAIQSLSSHEKGRRWERYKCVFVLKSIHRDEHFPCIQFFFFFFFSIRFYFFIFPHSVFGEERLLCSYIYFEGRGIIE